MMDNMAFKVNENHIWIATHGKELDKYPGKWIAVDQSKLIGVADTLKELDETPEVKTAKHPLFFLVPTEEETNSILIL